MVTYGFMFGVGSGLAYVPPLALAMNVSQYGLYSAKKTSRHITMCLHAYYKLLIHIYRYMLHWLSTSFVKLYKDHKL